VGITPWDKIFRFLEFAGVFTNTLIYLLLSEELRSLPPASIVRAAQLASARMRTHRTRGRTLKLPWPARCTGPCCARRRGRRDTAQGSHLDAHPGRAGKRPTRHLEGEVDRWRAELPSCKFAIAAHGAARVKLWLLPPVLVPLVVLLERSGTDRCP